MFPSPGSRVRLPWKSRREQEPDNEALSAAMGFGLSMTADLTHVAEVSFGLADHSHAEFQGTTIGTISVGAPANSIIVLCILHQIRDEPVGSVDTVTCVEGLDWQQRHALSFDSGSGRFQNMETWWAATEEDITGDVVTVTLDTAAANASIVAFAVAGANLAAPWDANASVPATLLPPDSDLNFVEVPNISTNSDDAFVWAFFGSGFNSVAADPGTGYTGIEQYSVSNFPDGAQNSTEYKIITSAMVNETVTFQGAHRAWGVIVDAIVPAA